MDECIEDQQKKDKQEKRDGYQRFTSSQESNSFNDRGENVSAHNSFEHDFAKTKEKIDEVINRQSNPNKKETGDNQQTYDQHNTEPIHEFKDYKQQSVNQINPTNQKAPPVQQHMQQPQQYDHTIPSENKDQNRQDPYQKNDVKYDENHTHTPTSQSTQDKNNHWNQKSPVFSENQSKKQSQDLQPSVTISPYPEQSKQQSSPQKPTPQQLSTQQPTHKQISQQQRPSTSPTDQKEELFEIQHSQQDAKQDTVIATESKQIQPKQVTEQAATQQKSSKKKGNCLSFPKFGSKKKEKQSVPQQQKIKTSDSQQQSQHTQQKQKKKKKSMFSFNFGKKKKQQGKETKETQTQIDQPIPQKSQGNTPTQSQVLSQQTQTNQQVPIDGIDQQTLDDDVRKLLAITDDLLTKLPEHVIEDFASSEDFALYQKVMSKYNIK